MHFIEEKDLSTFKKLFLVPVGLPGMGKSTLAQNVKLSLILPAIEYHLISYDSIVKSQIEKYTKLHPEVSFHEAFDIVRPLAD